jgi:hypothetical protein
MTPAMLLMTLGLYFGAAFGFYTYLLRTAQVMPEEFVEATMPARDEPTSLSQRQAA